MDEHQNMPQYGGYVPPPQYTFSVGKREILFLCAVFLFSALLVGSFFYHGIHLGFAVGAAGLLASSYIYLKKCGYRTDRYSGTLLILSLVITAAFPRGDDGLLKILSLWMLLVVPGLAFCLMSGVCTTPQRFSSFFSGFGALFSLGIAQLGAASRGIRNAFRNGGKVSKTGGAVALGLLIAVPIVAVLSGLLISADAAFEGLLNLLPEIRWQETAVTLLFGVPLGYVLYTRTAALHYLPRSTKPVKVRKGLHALTVNTVLIAASFVYLVYLGSQTAYFVGGFAGILPADYTLAEYARRGFFEMGWLCAINLLLITLSVALISSRGDVPGLSRVLCLFLGLITLFLVATASAKMLLYINSFGLTRLRVLTEVFMLWLGATTVFACIWLFRLGSGYIKQSVVLALALCAALLWCDVDTCVARYNVRAYQKGKLETVDLTHLEGLSAGAVPYLAALTQDSNQEIADRAVRILENKAARFDHDRDLRSWNWTKQKAWAILEAYRVDDSSPEAAAEDKELLQTVSDVLGIDVTDASVTAFADTHGGFHGDGETVIQLYLSDSTAANIEKIAAGEAGWHDLPMPDEVQKLRCFFEDDSGQLMLPVVREGLYYFCDRHSQSTDPFDFTAIHSRASYNFTLAVYDREAQLLYYLELDT